MSVSPYLQPALPRSPKIVRRAVLRGAVWLGLTGLANGTARAQAPAEGFVLIVNRENQVASVNRDFVADVFLKRISRWDDGALALPTDQAAGSAVRRAFSATILNRSVGAVRSYWQQRIFSGRDTPPPEVDSDAAVVQFVARYRGAIGYVSLAAKLGDDSKAIAVR